MVMDLVYAEAMDDASRKGVIRTGKLESTLHSPPDVESSVLLVPIWARLDINLEKEGRHL
jgi:hypothetical protein